MRSRLLLVFMMLVSVMSQAADDPILFTVGSMPVTRSEFEQSYLKNTTVSRVSRLTVADYLKLYIEYKLKVKAALDAHIDAAASFRAEYARSIDGQSEMRVSALETVPVASQGSDKWRVKKMGHGEAICPAQIMIRLSQKASREEQRQAQKQIESIYQDLQNGMDFGQLARRYSQDKKSSVAGGVMGWYVHGQMLKEIEDIAFGLKKGEISRPFLSTIGFHILMMKDRKPCGELDDSSFGSVEERQTPYQVSVTEVEMPTQGLQKEFYEGLLLYEQSKQSVGRHAAEDEEALKYYFKKHKKRYRRKGFKPKSYTEVRGQVVADLQEEMNKRWVADLRKKYPVNVNKKVLKTVNNHY